MATSDRFWETGAGRWLGSVKNITGSALAVLAVGAQLAFGLGPLWPLIVVGAYGIGALAAPRDRVELRLGLSQGASADAVRQQLVVLRRRTRALDPDARELLEKVLGALDEIVARWPELGTAPEQRHTVEQIVGDYLPTSLQAYLNLPRGYAIASRTADRRSAHDELLQQLGILDAEVGRIRDAVYAAGLDKLADQGRFLREKFSRSPLDLE